MKLKFNRLEKKKVFTNSLLFNVFVLFVSLICRRTAQIKGRESKIQRIDVEFRAREQKLEYREAANKRKIQDIEYRERMLEGKTKVKTSFMLLVH